jgi:riboflavin synthase alpha subunit
MGTAVVGDRVNVEVDLLAKYAEKMLAAQFEATGKR